MQNQKTNFEVLIKIKKMGIYLWMLMYRPCTTYEEEPTVE